jgi:hypothetical protein
MVNVRRRAATDKRGELRLIARRVLVVTALLVGLTHLASAAAEEISFSEWLARQPVAEESAAQTEVVKRQIPSLGRWSSNQDGRGVRMWQGHALQLTDDSVRGRLNIIGSRVASSVAVEGHVVGSDIFGALLDDGGAQVGTFQGTMSDGSASGTYTFKNGDTGTWGWDLPAAPAQVTEEVVSAESEAAVSTESEPSGVTASLP